jgi:hypothetical protein
MTSTASTGGRSIGVGDRDEYPGRLVTGPKDGRGGFLDDAVDFGVAQ